MKYWPGVLVFVYVAAALSLAIPGVLLASLEVDSRAIPGLIALLPYWLWVAVMVVCQTVLLAVPVAPVADWPLRRRSILLPIFLTGLMIAGLVCGAFYSFLEFHLQENVYLEANYRLVWHYPLACGAALWAGWTVLFYLLSRRRHPAEVVASQRRILFAGCLLELLVALPLYLVARGRKYCYASVLTSFGIGFGVAVALFAFGPALLWLYATRWREWHARRAPRREQPLPRGDWPVVDAVGQAGAQPHLGGGGSRGDRTARGGSSDGIQRRL
jgi:hypothetical protein